MDFQEIEVLGMRVTEKQIIRIFVYTYQIFWQISNFRVLCHTVLHKPSVVILTIVDLLQSVANVLTVGGGKST